MRGAFGVNADAYIEAIRIIESGRFPLEKMASGKYELADTEEAIRSLADGDAIQASAGCVPRPKRRQPMLVDMHAHVIPGALDAVGGGSHRGPHIGPCDDPHARLLENDRGMKFKAIDAFYSAERRLEELERSGVDAEVVSPMPPLLDYALSGPEGLELSRRVNEFVAAM